MSIPIINLSSFFDGKEKLKKDIAYKLDIACRDIGFFGITGHGVDEKVMSRARRISEQFFNLSTEEKLLVERPPQKVSRGYNRFMDRSLSYSIGKQAPPDLQEAFAFGPEEYTSGDWIEDDPNTAMLAPNRWPINPPEFRKIMLEYDFEMRLLGDRMLKIISYALKIEPSYFDDKFDHQSSVARLIRYPAQKSNPKKGQFRAGEHTDYGTITFLRGDPVPGGTEVKTREGDWIEIQCPPGGFVCNIGDALARWTNDRWISTLHRVANPPKEAKKMDRISLVYFHSPNHDSLIECLPSCIGTSGKRYKSITFSNHYLSKVMKAAHGRLNAKVEDAAKLSTI